MLTIFKGIALNLLTVRPILVAVIMRAHLELIQSVWFQVGDLHTLTCAANIIYKIELKNMTKTESIYFQHSGLKFCLNDVLLNTFTPTYDHGQIVYFVQAPIYTVV